MHTRYMECCDISIQLLEMTNKEHIEKAIQERELCIQSIAVYREVISDILNYMRYYPEALLLYKQRLEEAIKERDESTK
jgi:hypothetical protein